MATQTDMQAVVAALRENERFVVTSATGQRASKPHPGIEVTWLKFEGGLEAFDCLVEAPRPQRELPEVMVCIDMLRV